MAGLEGGEHSGEDENNEFRQAFFSRKLADKEKIQLITDVESYPALWMIVRCLTKVQKATALNAMSLKFSLNEDSVKKALHSLRSSLIREIRRESEDSTYKSSWKFYNYMSYMKEDVLQSLKQEAEKQWSEKEIIALIELHVLWYHLLQEYQDRNLRKLAMDKIKASFVMNQESMAYT